MSISSTNRLASLSLKATKRSLSTSSTSRLAQPWSDPIPANSRLNKYVIIAEDHTDSSALSRRLEVRERHLEQAAAGKEVGRILGKIGSCWLDAIQREVSNEEIDEAERRRNFDIQPERSKPSTSILRLHLLGGAILRRDFSEIPEEEGPTTSMAGSVLIVQGESIEDVQQRLSRDEYVLGRVFDPSKTRILPFLQATATSSTSPLLTPSPHASTLSETTKMGTRTRLPSSQSSVKLPRNSRFEVHHVDPRPGNTLNSRDRRPIQDSANSLRQLRSNQSLDKKVTPKKDTTLGSLRSNHSWIRETR